MNEEYNSPSFLYFVIDGKDIAEKLTKKSGDITFDGTTLTINQGDDTKTYDLIKNRVKIEIEMEH